MKTETPKQLYVASQIVAFDATMLGRGAEIADLVNSFATSNSKAMTFQKLAGDAKTKSEKTGASWPTFTLTNPQYQALVRQFATGKAAQANLPEPLAETLSHVTSYFTLPSVTLKANTNATVEVIRDFLFPSEFEPSAKDAGKLVPVTFESKLLGVIIDINAGFSGTDPRINMTYKISFTDLREWRDFKSDAGEKLQIPTFQNTAFNSEKTLLSLSTLAVIMEEAAIPLGLLSGKYDQIGKAPSNPVPVIVFMTPSLISPVRQ